MPPPGSRAQREDVLRSATAVRRQRAQLKRDFKAGRCTIESQQRPIDTSCSTLKSSSSTKETPAARHA
jgi:hypothetical protein